MNTFSGPAYFSGCHPISYDTILSPASDPLNIGSRPARLSAGINISTEIKTG